MCAQRASHQSLPSPWFGRRFAQVAAGLVVLSLAVVACTGDDAPTNPAAMTPTPLPMAVGHQAEDIRSFTAAPGPDGPWQGLIIQGVQVELPASDEWEVRIITDPCSDNLRKLVILRSLKTDARIKVDMLDKHVTAKFSGAADAYDSVVDRIQGSLKGERQLEEATEEMLPLPTSAACDPSQEIPILGPAFDVTGTVIPEKPEPTQTPDG